MRRYGHHISVDYFADLTAVLASLARRASLALPLRLQALATGVHISRCSLQRSFGVHLHAEAGRRHP